MQFLSSRVDSKILRGKDQNTEDSKVFKIVVVQQIPILYFTEITRSINYTYSLLPMKLFGL